MDKVSIQRMGEPDPAAGARLFSEPLQHFRERSGRLASRRAGIDLVSRRGNDGGRSRNDKQKS